MITGRLRCVVTAVFMVVAVPPFAQSQPCPPARLLLTTADPAYHDAQQLAGLLRDHGFLVQCIYPSKFGSMFQIRDGGVLRSAIEGEAAYLTNFGSFDVVFVPKPEDFSGFTITEVPQRSGHLYLLSGKPHVMSSQFASADPQYFLKHENELFIIGDAHLRERIEQALRSTH